jgi:hypothetical protein
MHHGVSDFLAEEFSPVVSVGLFQAVAKGTLPQHQRQEQVVMTLETLLKGIR